MKKPVSKEEIAESSIRKLTESGDLKKITPQDANRIGDFFETRSMNRLQTAKLIYESSRNNEKKLPATYSDYSEAVAAAYYSMFYIVHAYLACVYNTKLREGIRGVHAITNHLVLFYLVKTNKLAKHLYEEYLATLETTSSLSIIVKKTSCCLQTGLNPGRLAGTFIYQ
ncbi:MAG: hypothetical protein AABX47_07055 [Nanoarchaeota archaeon]